MQERATKAYQELRQRVLAVAALHRRCALTAGAGRLIWRLGVPLLVLLLAEYLIGLPLLLRLLVLPAFAGLLLWWGWRLVGQPLLTRYSLARAALLIEARRPELKSRVISALELYPELEAGRTAFDAGLVAATVIHAQESTRDEDLGQVIDRTPARRHAAAALATVLLWAAVLVTMPGVLGAAFGRMAGAWADARSIAQRISGARLVIEPPDQPAYLRGSDVTLRVTEKGFHSDTVTLRWRAEGESEWRSETLAVAADGRAQYVARDCQQTFECSAEAGRILSPPMTVTVTERPRLVKLSVEYDLPAYAKRAPVVQPRSDGNLKALFGSSVLLTIEANKPLKAALLKTSFRATPETCSVGGRFAQAALRLDLDRWLQDALPSVTETYTLRLTDEYGFVNEDADRAYQLVVVKDQGPEIEFVGLPHRSSAAEPHVLEKDLGNVGLTVRVKDDYGVTKVTLCYRLESLETGEQKGASTKTFPMSLPKPDIPALSLARLSQLGAQIGDRIVFWAETEDCFDLGPGRGPHQARTPAYKIAVVSEEQLFRDIVYRDDWSAHWYDGLKVAALANRSPPPRIAPESEPAAKLPPSAMDALPQADGVGGSDRLIIQSYFDSLSDSE